MSFKIQQIKLFNLFLMFNKKDFIKNVSYVYP